MSTPKEPDYAALVQDCCDALYFKGPSKAADFLHAAFDQHTAAQRQQIAALETLVAQLRPAINAACIYMGGECEPEMFHKLRAEVQAAREVTLADIYARSSPDPAPAPAHPPLCEICAQPTETPGAVCYSCVERSRRRP